MFSRIFSNFSEKLNSVTRYQEKKVQERNREETLGQDEKQQNLREKIKQNWNSMTNKVKIKQSWHKLKQIARTNQDQFLSFQKYIKPLDWKDGMRVNFQKGVQKTKSKLYFTLRKLSQREKHTDSTTEVTKREDNPHSQTNGFWTRMFHTYDRALDWTGWSFRKTYAKKIGLYLVGLYLVWKCIQYGIAWVYDLPIRAVLYRRRRKLAKLEREVESMKSFQ